MKKILAILGALLCAMLIPGAMAIDHHGDGNAGDHDMDSGIDPLGSDLFYTDGSEYGPGYSSSMIYVGSDNVVKYTSTGHTFHSTTYNPHTGVTTYVNPTHLGTQLYSYPIQGSDGTITLYGYNGYYPFGYNDLTGIFYFYGDEDYYDYYTLYDPWYRTVAWPFLNGHGFVPGVSKVQFVSNPSMHYTYSNSVHYGAPGEWLPFV